VPHDSGVRYAGVDSCHARTRADVVHQLAKRDDWRISPYALPASNHRDEHGPQECGL
jgi:hypothetical protein